MCALPVATNELIRPRRSLSEAQRPKSSVFEHTVPGPAGRRDSNDFLRKDNAQTAEYTAQIQHQHWNFAKTPVLSNGIAGPLEREADSIADHVVGAANPFDSHLGYKHTQFGKPESHTKTGGMLHSSGQPLDPAIRTFMGSLFGYDFSQVQVHTGSEAANAADRVDALAYTVGRQIVFGAGQYKPGTIEGRRLLAHELTHVVQQNGLQINGHPKVMGHGRSRQHAKSSQKHPG
jgi:hypothetical protein